MNLKTKTVSELNQYIATLLERDKILSNTRVKGIISGLGGRDGEHLFFKLVDPRDSNNIISCVLFQGNRRGISIELANDIAVVVSGKLSIYRRQGIYQISVINIDYDEDELYHNEYLRMQTKYEALGYFDPSRKLQFLPSIRRMGLIASKTSAAYGDFMEIVNRDYPLLSIRFIDVHVQGDDTKIDIPLAIKKLNDFEDLDLIVITRGGGSDEELFVFNDEAICSAVHASGVPILSAIGHQRDHNLMDRTAHMSVGTPSMAANLIVESHKRDIKDVRSAMLTFHAVMGSLIASEKAGIATQIGLMQDRLREELSFVKKEFRAKFSDLIRHMEDALTSASKDLNHTYELLKFHDIEETLERGYALVTKDGEVLRVEDLRPGDKLDIRLSRARLGVSLESIELKGEDYGEEEQ